jgi:hypothetical protein
MARMVVINNNFSFVKMSNVKTSSLMMHLFCDDIP